MEGLEIKEIKFSDVWCNKDKRIDTQFWTENIYYNPELKYKRIGDCLLKAQYGISINMNEESDGYPIYRMNEIHNMLCDLEVSKFADVKAEELEVFKLQNKDVLFNRTNSFEWVGRTGIYYKNHLDLKDYIFASYLVKFTPDPSVILPEYLATFLNTKFGILDIKRRARQSINQTNVNPEEVKEIRIPILSSDIQMKIAEKFELAFKYLVSSTENYKIAEQKLLNSCDLNNFYATNKVVNIKSIKDSFLSTGRLDSEYYQPKYEEYFNKITSGTYTTIGKEYSIVKENINKELLYFNYIEIGDINVSDGKCAPHRVKMEDLPDNAKIKAKKGDLLISKVRPYRGAVSIIEDDYENLVVSGAFTVLRNDKLSNFNIEILKVLLRTPIYKDWLLQFNVGTSYPVIRDEDVLNLPIPIVSSEIQNEITELIRNSTKLKSLSEKLLNLAKKSVEIAIDENEAKSINFIIQESKCL